jgi:hypothetical protein
MSNTRQVGGPSRRDLLREARGYIAESGDLRDDHASVIGISGTLYFQQVYLMPGDIITTVDIGIGVAPVALTLAKVGFWDAVTGTLLASTADQSASWATVGIKANALQATLTIPSPPANSGIYYIGHLAIASTTMPSVCSGTAAPVAARANLVTGVGGRPILFGSTTGLSDLPATLTIAAGAAPGTFWYGLR